MLKNGVDIGPHQIIQSDEDDDVQAYGFPSQKRRNRVQQSDLELELTQGGELHKKPTTTSTFLLFVFCSLHNDLLNILLSFPSRLMQVKAAPCLAMLVSYKCTVINHKAIYR